MASSGARTSDWLTRGAARVMRRWQIIERIRAQ
jgi:hypothetical protein